MGKEEKILFPAIRKMMQTQPFEHGRHESIENMLRVMESEHETAGNALLVIRGLTHNYAPPADACNTFRALYTALADLELDMHLHVHKENSILFPAALDREHAHHLTRQL